MKNILIAAASVLMIAGCASTPEPNFFNGKPYMAGDSDCVKIRALSDTRIMCVDKKGKDTGYRDAMTPEEMQLYYFNKLNQQIQMQQLSQSLKETNQSLQNSFQQFHQQSQPYTMPQLQPMENYGSSGRSRTTYHGVGNSIIGSDGTRCQVIGQNVICR